MIVTGEPVVTQKVTFQVEELTGELINQMWPLWKEHYEELTLYKEFPLKPDLELYKNLNQQNRVRVYTARHHERLIGYMVFFIAHHPHYVDMRAANQDILFIDRGYRKGFMGYRFIKWADEDLRRIGVDVVFQHVKAARDIEPLLHRLGYQHQDTIYSRRLG